MKLTLGGRCLFLLLVLFTLGTMALAAAPKAHLPAKYATWLNEEAPYIITDTERSEFLGLATDADRDAFIQTFWEVRNPDPAAPTNAYRDEHYRRLAYASDHFGTPGRHDGWRTDRGMVYITLGPPQQLTPYRSSQYLTPLEIWFYQSPSDNHALPPYFSVMFFQRTLNEDYKLYSPYIDRPEKLVQSTNAVNDQGAAIRIIQQDLGEEVAHLSLSLLPNEPVDMKDQTPSLESDAMLNRIRNYRNLPENRELLEERRAVHENVSHRIVLGEQFSDLTVMATRDGDRRASISYLLGLFRPEDFSVAQQADGRYFYAVTIEAALADSHGEIIYRDTQDLSSYLSEAEVADRRTKRLALEGRLPAAPGDYELRLRLTNKVTKQTFAQTRAVAVPGFAGALNLSHPALLALSKPQIDRTNSLPFTFAGIRLRPLGSDNAMVAAGQPVRLLYQVWERGRTVQPQTSQPAQTGAIHISYTLGQLGRPEKSRSDQELDQSGFDAYGNMLVGKDLDTTGLPPGPYRLVIQATDPVTHETASQAHNLHIGVQAAADYWRLISPSSHGGDDPLDAYRRGQCAMQQKDQALAIEYLRQSLADGYPAHEAYGALAQIYRESGDTTAAEDAQKRAGPAPATQHPLP